MATLKYSRQREMIKDFLMGRKDHPTADVVYMEEAVSICDRIMLINKGSILIEGTIKDIYKESGKDNLRDAFFELTRRDNDE